VNKKINKKWYFLLLVIITYVIVVLFDIDKSKIILFDFIKLLKEIIPILTFVFFFMFLMNYFVNNEILKKHMWDEAWIKWWLIAIIWWILSTWPIYVWYPFMKNLQEAWIKDRYLAAFLYNRWIKLQWLPILISYFSLNYSIILLITMAIFSIPQWIMIEKLIKKY